jgi:hypothetical protein
MDHTLIGRRRYASVIDKLSFRGEDCDLVAKSRERLAVCKLGTQKFDMERFSVKKLNEVEGKEQYQVKMSNRIMSSGGFGIAVFETSGSAARELVT